MKLIPKAHFAFLEYSNSISGFGETEYKSTLINFYRISSNRSPRLLLEPPGSPMNMILFKTPRFLVLYLLLQSEIPSRPYRRSANHANMHEWRNAPQCYGECAISSMIAFRPPPLASVRDPACIWDPASIRGNTVTLLGFLWQSMENVWHWQQQLRNC